MADADERVRQLRSELESLQVLLRQRTSAQEEAEQRCVQLERKAQELVREEQKKWLEEIDNMRSLVHKVQTDNKALMDELKESKSFFSRRRKSGSANAPDMDDVMMRTEEINKMLRTIVRPMEQQITSLQDEIVALRCQSETSSVMSFSDGAADKYKSSFEAEKRLRIDLEERSKTLNTQNECLRTELMAVALQLDQQKIQTAELKLTWEKANETFMETIRNLETRNKALEAQAARSAAGGSVPATPRSGLASVSTAPGPSTPVHAAVDRRASKAHVTASEALDTSDVFLTPRQQPSTPRQPSLLDESSTDGAGAGVEGGVDAGEGSGDADALRAQVEDLQAQLEAERRDKQATFARLEGVMEEIRSQSKKELDGHRKQWDAKEERYRLDLAEQNSQITQLQNRVQALLDQVASHQTVGRVESARREGACELCKNYEMQLVNMQQRMADEHAKVETALAVVQQQSDALEGQLQEQARRHKRHLDKTIEVVTQSAKEDYQSRVKYLESLVSKQLATVPSLVSHIQQEQEQCTEVMRSYGKELEAAKAAKDAEIRRIRDALDSAMQRLNKKQEECEQLRRTLQALEAHKVPHHSHAHESAHPRSRPHSPAHPAHPDDDARARLVLVEKRCEGLEEDLAMSKEKNAALKKRCDEAAEKIHELVGKIGLMDKEILQLRQAAAEADLLTAGESPFNTASMGFPDDPTAEAPTHELVQSLTARIHAELATRRNMEKKLIDARMRLFEADRVREELAAYNEKLQVRLEKYRLSSSPQLQPRQAHGRRRSSTATE